jgi:hypothetical protein
VGGAQTSESPTHDHHVGPVGLGACRRLKFKKKPFRRHRRSADGRTLLPIAAAGYGGGDGFNLRPQKTGALALGFAELAACWRHADHVANGFESAEGDAR